MCRQPPVSPVRYCSIRRTSPSRGRRSRSSSIRIRRQATSLDYSVVALSTGNVVITSPYDDFGATDAGAVYLFNGTTGPISTLRLTVNDCVGIGSHEW